MISSHRGTSHQKSNGHCQQLHSKPTKGGYVRDNALLLWRHNKISVTSDHKMLLCCTESAHAHDCCCQISNVHT